MTQQAAELMHNYLYKILEALLFTVIQTDDGVKPNLFFTILPQRF